MNHLWFRDKLDANNYSEVEVRDNMNLLEPGSATKPHARKPAGGGSRSLNRQAAGAVSAEQRPRRGPAAKALRRPMRDLFGSATELKIGPTGK